MEFYTRYKRPEVSGLVCPENSLTEQVYKDQCDLNFLIRKYHLDDDPFQLKMLVDPASRKAEFLDTTQIADIYTALFHHQHVKRIFESLDYAIQKKFDFSVDAFAEYVLTADVKDINALGIPQLSFKVPTEQKVSETNAGDAPKQESSSNA